MNFIVLGTDSVVGREDVNSNKLIIHLLPSPESFSQSDDVTDDVTMTSPYAVCDTTTDVITTTTSVYTDAELESGGAVVRLRRRRQSDAAQLSGKIKERSITPVCSSQRFAVFCD